MIVECLTIFGLIFAVVVVYLHAGRKDHAFATVPLLVLPAANVLSYMLSGRLSNMLPMDMFTVYTAINVFAVVVSSCLVGIMSAKFGKRSTRAAYITMSLVFNVMLAAILVYNMYGIVYK
ncbi:MAG: hypothetical protein J1F11_00075 [Oscillospiraceae bacterium]|nr:hypothetical protein [Oscillospiraceae bacterium]